jgi:hypothetical protein
MPYEICSKALVVRSRRFSIAHSSQRLTKGFQITPQPYKLGGGPDARRIARTKKLAEPALRTPAPLSPPAQPLAPPTPALVAHTQGGMTLSLEEGELDADFCKT